MKLVGKVLLIKGFVFLLAGIVMVVALIGNIQSAIQAKDFSFQTILGLVLAVLITLTLLFGGLGGIFYAIGHGPFRNWVSPICIILLVLWIVHLVLNIITYAKGGAGSLWDVVLLPALSVGIAEALYVVGWLLAREK